ncbi:Rhodanese-related sulfurtransferase [Belliella baltica DSM 15883]|uniref:Rhodanese-related sulfurtransferase n=2 Tax=Belliella TaxID=232244 RepID=I3Z5U8_BELBD|nr:Rhodanese-related sulfurtransferase [Belliella baltica DSM 15883]
MNIAQSLAYKMLLKGVYDNDFPTVKPHQKEILGNALLLDTREREEFEVSHLKGAKWVGYNTFSLETLEGIPKDQVLVVYCSIGARSQEIGKKLKGAGYEKVYNLYGGIFHWVNEDRSVFNQEAEQTDRVHAYSRSWGIWLNKGVKVFE